MATSLFVSEGVMYVAELARFSCEQSEEGGGARTAAAACAPGGCPQVGCSSDAPAEKYLPHAVNCGSIGHPHYCKRVCMFFESGKCTRGTSCGFCHEGKQDHPEGHLRNLSKEERQALDIMGEAMRERLLTAAMRDRVSLIPTGPGHAPALQEWLSHAGAVPRLAAIDLPKLEGIKPSCLRRTVRHIQSMNLHILTCVMRRTCAHSAMLEPTEALLSSLRAPCS